MALLKSDARLQIRQLLDDSDARWWTDANLDKLSMLVYDDRWAEILQFAPRATSQLDTLTSLTSPGYIRLPLTTATIAGDLSQRFFRVQSIVRAGQEYSPTDPRWILVENSATVGTDAGAWKWYRQGTALYLFPLDTATQVEFRYSYLPAAYTSLADSTAIVWPEGGEMAFIYEVAGRAMMKGGQELAAGQAMLAMANRIMRETVIPMAERLHAGPAGIIPADTSESWGSE